MTSKGQVWLTVTTLLILMVITGGQAQAEIPAKINYQFRLTDSSGDPLPGTHTVRYAMFDAETGGTELWTETKEEVADATGVVSTILGSEEPIALSFAGPVWLEVRVDDESLSPRREIVSSAYAFRAAAADWAADAPNDGDWVREGDDMHSAVAGNVGIGTTSPEADLSVVGGLRVAHDPAETRFLEAYHGGSDAVLNWVGDGDLEFRYANTTLASVTQGGDLQLSGTVIGTVDNADKVDGYDAGNSSGQVAISNGTRCTSLNADKVDGYDAGNASGQVAVSNGIKCVNLNADKVNDLRIDAVHVYTGLGTEYIVNTSWIKIYAYGTAYALRIENPATSGATVRYYYSIDNGVPVAANLDEGESTDIINIGWSMLDIRIYRYAYGTQCVDFRGTSQVGHVRGLVTYMD